MSCVWIGLIKALPSSEITEVLKLEESPTPKQFIKALKRHNVLTLGIAHHAVEADKDHQNRILEDNEYQENFNRIERISPKKLKKGYLCSGCDPLFFLIAYLFKYDIRHSFRGTCISYTCPNAKGMLVFGSNSYHFYYIRSETYC
ncbi:Hypothetical protein POVR1_LOCUS550 [uncultured virus]|nr:Hypothetical protein POVR1_LOCUS550 [uncultured virus]